MYHLGRCIAEHTNMAVVSLSQIWEDSVSACVHVGMFEYKPYHGLAKKMSTVKHMCIAHLVCP